MKKILFTLSIALFSTLAFSQNNVQELLNKYRGQDDVNIISINGNMFKLGSSFIEETDKESKVAKEIASQIDELNIINTQTKSKGLELSKSVNKLIRTNNYEELMTINSEGEEVKFYGKVKNEKIEEFFILVGEDEETTLISMRGKIDSKQISTLLKKTNFN
ncbi:MAG: DUF4252 domain-containing protein [Flavobacteriales bacterium]|nr:DUF4252 domain-containing protein [Flavobacteriales bacterium]